MLRFEISEWIAAMRLWAPLAVLAINVSGCWLISFLNFVSDPAGNIYLGPRGRLFLMAGFCGGYTTFSSFSMLCFDAVRHAQFLDLWLNVGLSHALCLLGVWLGYVMARPFPHVLFKFNRLLRRG